MSLPLISGADIVEGIVGGIATIIFYFILSLEKGGIKNHATRLGLAFLLTWIVRKISVNVYRHILVPKGMKVPPIHL